MAAMDTFFNGFCKFESSKGARELYEKSDFLGEGSYGEVHKATCLSTGQKVAM